MTVSTLELANAVLNWARTPGIHGRIEVLDFVTLAHEVVDEAAYKEHQAVDDARQRQRHGKAIARREAANTPWPEDDTVNIIRFDPTDVTHAKCDNCGKVHRIEDLDEDRDFWSRYTIGSECPVGDCPSCGAFCCAVRPDVV